ncbi:MAG: translation initiation factor IF-6 [Candidatus Diapherotrites archaeon]
MKQKSRPLMSIKTIALHGSPYVGIFCSTTDEIALVPGNTLSKEQKRIQDTLSVEAIPCTIAESHLIGVLARGLHKKFAVAYTATQDEIDTLHEYGVRAERVPEVTAIGNLFCIQKKGGIVSPLLPRETMKWLEKYFNIPLHQKGVAQTELSGSCVLATEKGFLAHPKTAPEEMEFLESIFGAAGMTTTANYGDPFIANSIIANQHGIIVGERTSGPELARIDEGLHPGLITRQG